MYSLNTSTAAAREGRLTLIEYVVFDLDLMQVMVYNVLLDNVLVIGTRERS
jgi:hypothetical protein